MSIPPLVCSTPPPPDQCEDDKEHEDYDYQYNLPPDEDYENQEYNFCHYQSNFKSDINEVESIPGHEDINTQNPQKAPVGIDSSNISDIKVISDNTVHTEENTIEDLNLKISAIDLQTSNANLSKSENNNDDESSPTTSIQDQEAITISNVEEENNDTFSIPVNPEAHASIFEDLKDSVSNVIPSDIENLTTNELNLNANSSLENESVVVDAIISNEVDTSSNLDSPIEVDEFGDFNDFQYINSETTFEPSSILNSENPWEGNEFDNQDFGDFKANFDEPETSHSQLIEDTDNPPSTNQKDTFAISEDISDDDFGDFDNFKLSSNETNVDQTLAEEISTQDILNIPLSKSDEQIVENVNNVLTSIFSEDISEPDTVFEVKLELLLGETWGHLIDTDIRQPYMVCWNNSLGQKSLLKALCIDSRNILFGPKWNYNAPKYASNLGSAPLQPQKQNGGQQVLEGGDKTASQVSSTWTDPFTPQGQESCNSETDKPVVNIKPKDLVINEEPPTNVTKIYSSTLSIQPLRQINLPDTHIFTPTDSETPRSKTIHYNSPSNLVQTNIEVNKIQSVDPPTKLEDSKVDVVNDTEYWDFQGFKQTSDTIVGSEQLNTPSTNKLTESTTEVKIPAGVYKTQILQPIKLEPMMPTLNWPDPGEVKETFFDFSDFTSNVSWNEKKIDSVPTSQEFCPASVSNQIVPDMQGDDKVSSFPNNDITDDDFETFQSASTVPQTYSAPIHTTNTVNTESETIFVQDSQNSKKKNLNYENVLTFRSTDPQEITSGKSHNSLSNETLSKAMRPHSSQNNLDILQPSISTPSAPRNHQALGQILEPMSLEGFSQINWPNPGINLQDLSRFNPIESVHSLKSDTNTSGTSKVSTPVHSNLNNDSTDDDVWGDFVSSAPKSTPKALPIFNDDDEWTDFVSNPNVKPQNGLNTISFNVQSNLSMQKSSHHMKHPNKDKQNNIDIPTLNYITPKSNTRGVYSDKHFQNL